MLSGSVKVGDNCWISPATVVRDGVSIGSESLIGLGSAVVSNLEKNSKVMGHPARPINDMKKILSILMKMTKDTLN